MNRKEFLKLVPAAIIAGATIDIVSCSRPSSSEKNKKFLDSLADAYKKNIPIDTSSVADTADPSMNFKKIVSGDTLNNAYTKPVLTNYTRARYCDIVAQNAEKVFPKSKPWLEAILRANNDFRYIYDIPPEYHIALLFMESKFETDAVSIASAIGIAQFMRLTAKDMGLRVYDEKSHKDLYDKEKELRALSAECLGLRKTILVCVDNNRFSEIEKYKLSFDKSVSRRNSLKSEIYLTYRKLVREHKLNDERTEDPIKSVIASAQLYHTDARECEVDYGGHPIHNMLRAFAAYNAGMRNVEEGEGIPFIRETLIYVREGMINADKISPKHPMGMIYDSNSQIISELMADKVYAINTPGVTNASIIKPNKSGNSSGLR